MVLNKFQHGKSLGNSLKILYQGQFREIKLKKYNIRNKYTYTNTTYYFTYYWQINFHYATWFPNNGFAKPNVFKNKIRKQRFKLCISIWLIAEMEYMPLNTQMLQG